MTALGSLVIAVGLITALGQIAFSILCITLVLWGAQRATRRFPHASIVILAATIMILEATVALLVPLLIQENPPADDGTSMPVTGRWREGQAAEPPSTFSYARVTLSSPEFCCCVH